MKFPKVGPKIKRSAHGIKHFLKTNKNDILFGAGAVTEVLAVISGIRAGYKQRDMHEFYARRLDAYVDQQYDTNDIRDNNAEERRAIYRQIAKETVKNYALPVALTAGSVGFYSKSHFNLKSQLASTTAALAAEHALNQRLLAEKNAEMLPQDESEDKAQETNGNSPYSAGIPNDIDNLFLKNAVIIYDSESNYFAEKEGYSQPTTVMLSPTSIKWEKDPYSDWTVNFDWNVNQIQNTMKGVISKAISLYGFVNLNEIRKHFSSGRSYKLEEAENYYIVFDENRYEEDQVMYRIYGECDENGCIIKDRVYIDIFNTIVPKPGDLKEAKQRAVAANPLKES